VAENSGRILDGHTGDRTWNLTAIARTVQYETSRKGGLAVPTYEFRCEDCRRAFTLVMSMAERDKGKISCPACKKRNVKQQMTTFQTKTSKKS
jgi:putative FmdB family regulatory protein